MSVLDLDAGAYGLYVWTAFALTGAVFAALIAASLSQARRWRRRAEQADQP